MLCCNVKTRQEKNSNAGGTSALVRLLVTSREIEAQKSPFFVDGSDLRDDVSTHRKRIGR